jgi:hypothetical protein
LSQFGFALFSVDINRFKPLLFAATTLYNTKMGIRQKRVIQNSSETLSSSFLFFILFFIFFGNERDSTNTSDTKAGAQYGGNRSN